ncbi:MAG: ABC transporter ATP-binding protein [Gammaproteobacteria bacterium]|nr:ABC transporter ATP-binding protein [Gammaproteobacteria bacterium]
MLQINNLEIAFGRAPQLKKVLHGVNLTLQAGEKRAIVGESGSGKSLTALSVLRLLDPHLAHYPSGSIHFCGEDLLRFNEERLRQLRGNQIAMIFQEPMSALNPLYTIGEQLSEPLRLHQQLSRRAALKQAEEMLQRVGIESPRQRLGDYPHQLSGGQQQRVMIAMALACSPQLLIADEPTTALDVTIQIQIIELLNRLHREEGMAILLISHDLNLVRHFADTVSVMERGVVVEEGEVATLFGSPQHPYTQRLLASEPQPLTTYAPVATTQPLLQGTDLRVHFPLRGGWWRHQVGVIPAVDGVSLTIYPGETLGIVGESGSGKSTLGMTLLRLQASQGEITFAGQRIDKLSERAIRPLRRQFQVVFQNPFASLSPRLNVADIVGEGLRLHFPELTQRERQQRIDAILTEVGLSPAIAERYPHEFSGGERQRIAIARTLVLQPQLIVLDEPTSALDVSVQQQVLALLRSLQQRHHLSYLFISHDLKVIAAMAHRLLVLRQGVVVESGETAAIYHAPQHPYTRQLLQAALFIRESRAAAAPTVPAALSRVTETQPDY